MLIRLLMHVMQFQKLKVRWLALAFLWFSTAGVQSITLADAWWLPFQAIPGYRMAQTTTTNSGLTWEFTPLFVPFAPGQFQSSVKTLRVEPVLRHTGGFEVYFDVDYFLTGQSSWRYRTGGRIFLPMVDLGESLGLIAGAGSELFNSTGIFAEIGIFTFYSILQITVAKHWFSDIDYSAAIQIRYF